MPAFDPRLHDDRLTCFLDDSALDSASDDHCVLGGVAFNPAGLDAFDEHWTTLMHRYRVEQPFHMRDLSRGQRLDHLAGCRRWCLLAEVTAAIKYFKLYTIAIVANNREHRTLFSDRMQHAMRVYRTTYLAILVANQQASLAVRYPGHVAYVLDRGTRHSEQVAESHSALRNDQPNEYRVGPLMFEDDRFSTHLQAADVVAWTRRRMAAGKSLSGAFSVLPQLFEGSHIEAAVTPDIWREMDQKFGPHLTERGWTVEPPNE